MRFPLHATLAVALCFLVMVSPARPEHGKSAPIITPTDVKWQDGPASLPKGAKMAVLEGDPSRKGPFVLRIKLPDGFRIMPHTHPKDERVTVLSGTLYLGHGGTFDKKAAKAMPAGAYGRTPAGMKHFGWVKGETVLQLHGEGPWAIDYVDPKDDPRKAKDAHTATWRLDLTRRSLVSTSAAAWMTY